MFMEEILGVLLGIVGFVSSHLFFDRNRLFLQNYKEGRRIVLGIFLTILLMWICDVIFITSMFDIYEYPILTIIILEFIHIMYDRYVLVFP